ncbi:MAG: HU family DNA-binding protein [Desulfobacteraceae bacterium]|nr:HU family DNA-binding protein [Desulfobacteraceae bacterium]
MLKNKEIIEKIARDAKITQLQAAMALASLFNTVIEEFKKNGNKISFPKLGTFQKVRSNYKMIYNIQSKKKVKSRTKFRIKYTASTVLKKALNPTRD